MGMNYYAEGEGEHIHLGKASHRWKFLLRMNRDYYHDWPSMCEWLKTHRMEFNEYGDEVSVAEFIELVESKQSEPNSHSAVDPEGFTIDGYEFLETEFS